MPFGVLFFQSRFRWVLIGYPEHVLGVAELEYLHIYKDILKNYICIYTDHMVNHVCVLIFWSSDHSLMVEKTHLFIHHDWHGPKQSQDDLCVCYIRTDLLQPQDSRCVYVIVFVYFYI